MKRDSYSYSIETAHRFIFKSVGRATIVKAVDFTPATIKGLYVLGFGDLLPDGTLDDMANSNNGDIVTVMLTVVKIVKDFTVLQPNATLIFSGSTDGRMKLYARIFNLYGDEFRKEFSITAVVVIGESLREVPFEYRDVDKYEAYIIKRIN